LLADEAVSSLYASLDDDTVTTSSATAIPPSTCTPWRCCCCCPSASVPANLLPEPPLRAGSRRRPSLPLPFVAAAFLPADGDEEGRGGLYPVWVEVRLVDRNRWRLSAGDGGGAAGDRSWRAGEVRDVSWQHELPSGVPWARSWTTPPAPAAVDSTCQ